MTYSVSVFGSMTDLEDESSIEQKARAFVESLEGVNGASLTTTNGGQVNLMASGLPVTPQEPGSPLSSGDDSAP